MEPNIGLILDGIILVLLGVTIFYAARLTIFLKSFRDSRDNVEKLLSNLSAMITKSETAINNMRGESGEAANALKNVINEASFLSDELRFMNETGDSLAGKLEKLVESNRELVDQLEEHGGVGRPRIKIDSQGFNHLEDEGWYLEVDGEQQNTPEETQDEPRNSKSGFMINDREYEEDSDLEEAFDDSYNDASAWGDVATPLSEDDDTQKQRYDERLSNMSEIERDLYDALKKTKIARGNARITESA